MTRPSPGSMVWWRQRGVLEWRFGYCTYIDGQHDLIRMGRHNGESENGPIVSISDIEWRKYT